MNRNDVLSIVRNRYTTKHYDPAKAVSEEDFNALLEVLRLSLSSVNSQPWEFFIARTPAGRGQAHARHPRLQPRARGRRKPPHRLCRA